jgi:hypothetical protein
MGSLPQLPTNIVTLRLIIFSQVEVSSYYRIDNGERYECKAGTKTRAK